MRTQINSDNNINVDTRTIHFVENEVNRDLGRFAGKLTRIEVHLSDVNSYKSGTNDKRCVIEARPARHRPLSASNRAPTVRQAVRGALDKMRSSLETFFGRLRKRGEDTVTATRHRPAIGRRRAPAKSNGSGEAGRVKRRSTRGSAAQPKGRTP
jgi:Sigma 54 modulation protein / S30EA ribosomal protein